MASVLAGISWPFRIEGNGLPASAKGTEVIKSSLTVLLRTPKGCRVMRPTLGVSIQKLVFENQGPALQSMIQREILAGIANFLPQVVVRKLDFSEDEHKIQVNVTYSVQGVTDQTGYVTIGQKGF
jgi:phage baseplate assembly protein W